MGTFYHLDVSAFQRVPAEQVKVGDAIALPDPRNESLPYCYGTARIDQIIPGWGIRSKRAVVVSVTFRLPIGARLMSTKDQTIAIEDWEGSTPYIRVTVTYRWNRKVLIKKQ